MQRSIQNVTTDKPTPSLLQAGCPFCRSTNIVSLGALNAMRLNFWADTERLSCVVKLMGNDIDF